MSVCVAPIKGTVMRLVRLDACGQPVTGSPSVIVTDCFVQITPSPQYEEGEEFVQRSADGELCVNEKDADALKRIDLTVQLCGVDPEVVEMFLGARLIEDDGEPVGFAVSETPAESRFSLEVWQQIAGGDCGGGGERWVHHVFPWVEDGRLGDFTVEYGPTMYELSASTRANPNWGQGPFVEWVEGLGPDEHYAFQVTSVPPPSPADVERLELEVRGAMVNQAAARTELGRWLTLIRQTGSGNPPAAGIDYIGGDVTDGILNQFGDRFWVMADYIPASVGVDPDDTYSGPMLPFRNAVISEQLSQGQSFFSAGYGGGQWLNAVAHGGLPNGSTWWPLTVILVNGELWVGAWLNDASVGPPVAPYGAYVDTHLIKLNAFGQYASHVACGFTDKKFFIECARHGSNGWIYVLGGQFNPPIDGLQPGEVGYANPNTIEGLRAQLDLTHRLARMQAADFGNPAAWEWWNGSSWVNDRSQAVELTEAAGRLINGSAGFDEVAPGHWVMVAHQMVDPHLDVLHAPAPEGPWTRHARVPLHPPTGRSLPDGQGFVLAWHSKVIKMLSAPAGHSIAMLTSWPKLTVPWPDRKIQYYAPMFAVVPHQ